MTGSDERVRRLLDAHVRFELERFRGGLAEMVAAEVDNALDAARRLTLDAVVDRQDVVDVAIKYVAGFRLPGAIPDLTGEIAMRVRTRAADDAALRDVVPRKHVAALVGRLAEMTDGRARLAAALAGNASVREWLAGFLHSLATSAVGSNRRLAERLPGMSAAFSLGDKVAGGAVREADRAAREVADRAAGAILERWRADVSTPVSDDAIDGWLDVWDDLAERSLADVLAAVEDDDLVDLLAIGYELWLDLRTSPYLHSLIGVGVDYVFDTYGQVTLDVLLAEFGLGRDDLVEEAMRFAPNVIAALDEAGELETLLRRRLAAFYDSDAARDALREEQ